MSSTEGATETVTVYRVEDREGRGPYITGRPASDPSMEMTEDMGLAHADSAHPSPSMDNIWDWTGHHVCGMSTLAGIGEWFKGFGEDLEFYRYRVAAYEIPRHNVLFGDSGQVMFKKRGNKPVVIMKPTDVIPMPGRETFNEERVEAFA